MIKALSDQPVIGQANRFIVKNSIWDEVEE